MVESRSSRGRGGPLSAEDVDALWEMVHTFEAGRLQPATFVKYRRTAELYEEVCAAADLVAYPPSYRSIALFCASHIRRGCKSTTLAQVLSHVKWVCMNDYTEPWLSADDILRLKSFKNGLYRNHPPVVARKLPITLDVLGHILLFADLQSPRDRRFVTMAWVAHNGLLRFSELAKLTVADVYWHASQVGLAIRQPKRPVGGPPQFAVLAPLGSFHGYAYLADYWVSSALHRAPGSRFLFADSRSPFRPPVRDTFVRWLRKVLAQASIRLRRIRVIVFVVVALLTLLRVACLVL
jgi:hypothetical protein